MVAPPAPVAVAGTAVADGYAYAARGLELQIFDVYDPVSPQPIGTFRKSVVGVAVFGDVAVAGSRAYVWWGNGKFGGILVVDISDPTSPVEIGSYDSGVSPIPSFVADGPYLYVARFGGLEIGDVSDPMSPRVTSYYATRSSGLGVEEDALYVSQYFAVSFRQEYCVKRG